MSEYLIPIDLEGISGVSDVRYGDDTHTLYFTVDRANQIPKLL